jgi:alpha-galactosidase
MPVLRAALDELDGNPQAMEIYRAKYKDLIKRPQEPVAGEPLCTALFRHFGAYPGPGDGHVGEFFPQLMRPLIKDVAHFQGEAISYVEKSYPVLIEKMKAIAWGNLPIDAEYFARELSWEHTQFLDIMASQQDNLGQTFYINIPNQGIITNLPWEAVVEVPAAIDAAGVYPFGLRDLPKAVVPVLVHKLSALDLIIEAAMEGSRRKAVQAMINDPHCTDIQVMERVVNELIDAELAYLPKFR